jgi:hypothetical protein
MNMKKDDGEKSESYSFEQYQERIANLVMEIKVRSVRIVTINKEIDDLIQVPNYSNERMNKHIIDLLATATEREDYISDLSGLLSIIVKKYYDKVIEYLDILTTMQQQSVIKAFTNDK